MTQRSLRWVRAVGVGTVRSVGSSNEQFTQQASRCPSPTAASVLHPVTIHALSTRYSGDEAQILVDICSSSYRRSPTTTTACPPTTVKAPIPRSEIPVTTQGMMLRWSGNCATIPGLLFETDKHLARNDVLQDYIHHHAVPISSGYTAVDAVENTPFILGLLDEPEQYSLTTKLCPPTKDKIAVYDRTRHLPSMAFASYFGMIDADTKKTVRLAPAVLKRNGGAKLFRVLAHVFGHADASPDLLDENAVRGDRSTLARRRSVAWRRSGCGMARSWRSAAHGVPAASPSPSCSSA